MPPITTDCRSPSRWRTSKPAPSEWRTDNPLRPRHLRRKGTDTIVRPPRFLLLLCRQRVEVGEHFVAVAGRLHLQVDLADDSRRVNEEGVAAGVGRSLVVGKRSVRSRDVMLGVCQELEVQALLGAEAL